MLDMLSNIMMIEVQEGEERKNEMEKYIWINKGRTLSKTGGKTI